MSEPGVHHASPPRKSLTKKRRIRPLGKISLEHFILWRNTRDAYLMILSCVLLFLVGCLAYVSNAYASLHNWSLKPVNRSINGTVSLRPLPVYDVFLNVIDVAINKTGIRPGVSYAMFFTNACLVSLIVRLLTLKRNSFTIIRRTFTYLSLLYGIRSLMVVVTVIPTPMPVCYYVIKDSVIETAIHNFFKGNESCGDVFFSGHAILYTISIFTWLNTPTLYHSAVSIVIVTIIITFGYTSLLVSKFHYTIDVISGVWFTISTILSYNWLITSESLRHKWYTRFLIAWDYALPEPNSQKSAAFTLNCKSQK